MNNITKATLNNLSEYSNDLECKIETSKDNKYIMKIKKDNRNIYIGSKYNVSRDIEKFIEEMGKFNKETVFVCFGLGAGEHIKKLVSMTEENKIIIFEPNMDIIEAFYKSKINNKILECDRVILNPVNEKILKEILNFEIEKESVNNIKIAFYANYKVLYDTEALNFYKVYFDVIKDDLIKINTDFVHAKHFYNSFMENIKYILHSKPVNDFKNFHKDMPAVVVSAGPSLEKNIDKLKDYQDKCIIITGGRTLKALLDRGITPDYVCAIDPDVPAYNVMQGTFDCNAPLVFCEYTYYEILRDYAGNKIFFNDVGLADLTKEFINYHVDNIYEAGSVAHVCAGFGVYTGCNPIIFIGQDLAYTNDKAHAESAGDTEVTNDNIVYVDDINGKKIKTDLVFNFFRIKLEELVKMYPNKTFINSTEGGANIDGTKIMPLKESLKAYSLKKKEYGSVVSDNIINKVDVESVIEKLKCAEKGINEVRTETTESLKLCKNFLNDKNRWNTKSINSINRKLDKTDKVINNNIKKMDFMRNLFAPYIYEVNMNKEYKERYNETEEEKVSRIYSKNVALYDGLSKAVSEAIPEIQKSIKSLESEKND